MNTTTRQYVVRHAGLAELHDLAALAARSAAGTAQGLWTVPDRERRGRILTAEALLNLTAAETAPDGAVVTLRDPDDKPLAVAAWVPHTDVLTDGQLRALAGNSADRTTQLIAKRLQWVSRELALLPRSPYQMLAVLAIDAGARRDELLGALLRERQEFLDTTGQHAYLSTSQPYDGVLLSHGYDADRLQDRVASDKFVLRTWCRRPVSAPRTVR